MKNNQTKILSRFLVFVVAVTVFFTSVILVGTPKVEALNCQRYGTVCGWANWYDPPKHCNEGDNGAQFLCCFWTNYPGTNCAPVSRSKCACQNIEYTCGGSSQTPTPTTCSCNERGCPPGRPATKYMTVMSGNGTGKSCGDPCNPNTYNCEPVSNNSPPSCSILPANITIARGDAPKGFNLTARDADYGDTVEVTLVQVKDTAGHLNSCVDVIKTMAGGSLAGAVVRSGTNNPAAVSQTTTFYVDARTARGVYENVNGQSICQGVVSVEIRDLDSDGGGADVSDYATCKVGITVINQAPQLSDVVISDRDEKSDIRDLGASGDGNLVDGRAQLFVGSNLTTNLSKVRASKCGEKLTLLTDPIICPGGGEVYESTFSRRRNPLLLEFTVSDGNGLDDIKQAGVWVQRSSQNRDKAVLPEIGTGKRNSFQSIYIESEVLQRIQPASSLLCYSYTAAAPTVKNTSICPTDCAACVKKEGVVTVAGNPNALRFKFGIYFNDKDNGQGMTDEEYSVFLSARDKVNAPFYQITGRGADGWIKFTKNGAACTGASCPGNTDFSLLYDPVAPTVAYYSWGIVGEDGVTATFNLNDKPGGSGLAGVTNRYMAKQEMLDGEPLGPKSWATKDPEGGDYDGNGDRFSPVGAAITLSGKGLDTAGGEEIVAGLCVYDRAGNMTCGRNREPYVYLSPWIKTSYGDVYSAKGGLVPFSESLPTEDFSVPAKPTSDNTKSLVAPYGTQVFTIGTGLMMTGGSPGQGFGLNGGILNGGVNKQLGFISVPVANFYRTDVDTSKFNIYGFTPFSPGNEYERLRASAILNCELMNAATTGTPPCQNNGSLASIGANLFNILYVTNAGTITDDIICKNINVLFVTGALELRGNVLKSTPASGCIFVLANGASLTINDTPSNVARTPSGDGRGSPYIDKFDAAIVANSGASIKILKGARGPTTKSTDRLVISGWVYSANTLPLFKRELAPVDNKRYPSEYVVYDAKLLDLFRPLLGAEKTVDLTCGTSDHVLCKTTN